MSLTLRVCQRWLLQHFVILLTLLVLFCLIVFLFCLIRRDLLLQRLVHQVYLERLQRNVNELMIFHRFMWSLIFTIRQSVWVLCSIGSVSSFLGQLVESLEYVYFHILISVGCYAL